MSHAMDDYESIASGENNKCQVLALNRQLYSTLLSDEEAMEMVAER